MGSRGFIIQNVTNYNINIYNGESGVVTEITDDGVKVKFDETGSCHLYKFKSDSANNKPQYKSGEAQDEDEYNGELLVSQLTHSFALSFHRMQGSEISYMIVYIPKRYNQYGVSGNFVNINMLYVALKSRPKVLLGYR